MKGVGSAALFIAATLIGLFIPEYGNVGALEAGFFNLVALVAMITAFTEGTKELIGYDPEEFSKWIPKGITVGWSLLFASISFFTNFGFYAELFDVWWHVAIASVLISGIARDFYSTDFGWKLIKLLFNKELPIE